MIEAIDNLTEMMYHTIAPTQFYGGNMTQQPYFSIQRANDWFWGREGVHSDFESRRHYINLISVESNLEQDTTALREGLQALLVLAHRVEKNRLSRPLLSKRKYLALYQKLETLPQGKLWSQHLNEVRKDLMDELARLGR